MILLVDGDRRTAECLEATLPDRRVERATDGSAALDLLAGHEHSLIFVDVDAVDDSTLPETIRERSDDVTLIAIGDEEGSDGADVADPEDDADAATFDDFLPKPIDQERLRLVVDRDVLLRRYHESVTTLYEHCERRSREGDPGDDETIAAARRTADERLQAVRERFDGEEFDRLFRYD